MTANTDASAAEFRCPTWLAATLIILAVLAAYYNSFSGVFVFDDQFAILQNPAIRHLWPLSRVLSPPASVAVAGRPLVNLSLAINYALGGTAVWGYHAVNLAIHISASLVLFGILRRIFMSASLSPRFHDTWLALAVALIWSVHPLQTESVTYIIQRAESLMGLFYLLTLYCFIRGVESRPALWRTLAVAACLCGMATKEVMISAPVMVLLYDRAFVAGSFGRALRLRWRFYLALAATWMLLGWLVITGGALRGENAGAHSSLGWTGYLLSEFGAIVHYLKLSLWPHPLVLDYGGAIVIRHILPLLPCVLAVILLLIATAVGLWRWPAIGFAGAWFFGILALTSGIFPLGDSIFEHRMYLPLATVVALVASAIHFFLGRWSRAVFFILALLCIALTSRRNDDYRSELAIWTDTVAKYPMNSRAQYDLANALLMTNRFDEAVSHYQVALRLRPNYPEAEDNLGLAYLRLGQLDKAAACFQETLVLDPRHAIAYNSLGQISEHGGHLQEAIAAYRQALRLEPENAAFLENLAAALARTGNGDEAIRLYQSAIALAPDDARAYSRLGGLFRQSGRTAEAASCFRKVVELRPDFAEGHDDLAYALFMQGQINGAIAELEKALEIRPNYLGALENLAAVLAASPDSSFSDRAKAVELAERANSLAGGQNPVILKTLATIYAEAGRFADAQKTANTALQLAIGQTNAPLADALRAQLKSYQTNLLSH